MPDTRLTLPLLPLHDGVVFPHVVVTLAIESDEGRAAIRAARGAAGRLLIVPRVDGRYPATGTIAEIQDMAAGSGVVVRGVARAAIGAARGAGSDALWVDAEEIVEPDVADGSLDDLIAEYRATIDEILAARGMGALGDRLLGVRHPGRLADLAAYSPDLTLAQKVELLETHDVAERLEKVAGWMRTVLGEMTLRRKVREDAAQRLDRSQREFVLRQQLETIRAELGDGDDLAGEYRQRLAELDAGEAVREAIGKEIDRLERTGPQSPEHGWIRSWLDTVFEVPWGSRTPDRLDLASVRAVLDSDHSGLSDVKERIVEHLAVHKLRAERGTDLDDGPVGAILLLVGPPGVGKTSLGESIARALGRRFVRVALGGIRDEAEVRGHRRTYVGARPGRIVRGLMDAGTMNPVFLLDEIDKVGADWRGDPASALLEVLDPAQNHTFRDHYLEMDLDLSDVLFVATANVVESIPAPLLDRVETIRIDGYTDEEKVVIARDHLVGRQAGAAGLDAGEITITDEALSHIVRRYTREAGVRGLERNLAKLMRKVATRIAEGESGPLVVDAGQVRPLLGRPVVHDDEITSRTGVPGVATGLAVTGAGGDVLFVEASAMKGEAGLTLTGQLGEVMQESARIALSYVRANADELGIEPADLDRAFHVHVPAGATPKDGPSAGITIATALVGLLTGRAARATVGMTGELTLRGGVLPIGGVKQKVLAAHRAGLTDVVLPARNEPDLDEVPEEIRSRMRFHGAADIAEVLAVAFDAPDSQLDDGGRTRR